MSKAIKKVFKKVKKTVSKVGNFIKDNWKPIVMVAAAAFTGGAALGMVGVTEAGVLGVGAMGSFTGGVAGVTSAWSGLGTALAGTLGMGPQNVAFTQAGAAANTAAANAAAANAGAGLTSTGALQGASALEAVGATTGAAGAGTGAAAAGGGLMANAGNLAQLGGLGLATYGALKDGEEAEDMEYAIPDESDYSNIQGMGGVGDVNINTGGGGGGGGTPQQQVAASSRQNGLMQPVRTRRSSRDDEAKRRYGRYV